MSPGKRHGGGSGPATQSHDEHQSALSRHKRPLLSTRQLGEGGIRLNWVQRDGYKPNSAPLQRFHRRHGKKLVSEGARPSNRNKRAPFRRVWPRKLSLPFSPNSLPYSGPPELFDVSPGLRDAFPPADNEVHPWEDKHAAFIKSAAGLDQLHWIGVRPLGFGGYGAAGLWERRDENNVLIEQIVVKESKTASAANWKGEVPEEVKMMRRMNNTHCHAVPELKAYRRYMHVKKHRIYMEFCPYRDLDTLNLNYKRFRAYFPEPFLWYTFNNLVKVAAAMQNGPNSPDWDYDTVHRTSQPANNWGYEIVHRDLKPANMFLGLEDVGNGFRRYPVAKTGDWGLAAKLKPKDYRNPILFRGAGTETYLAPEQRLPDSNNNTTAQASRQLSGRTPLQKLSSKTNVWGIGAIMFELLTHEAVDYYLHNEDWAFKEVLRDIPNVRTPKYSGALTDLIKLCLMPDPWDRPSVEELEVKIGTRCQSITDAYTADPSLLQKDRLYYKGSEINQMPPGDWGYWNPVMENVPHPSDVPDLGEIYNPFTVNINYPYFSSSETSETEEEGEGGENIKGEERNELKLGENNVEDDRTRKGQKGGSVGRPIIISDDPSSSSPESDSDNSETRRRMATKKPPGT